MAEIKRHEIKTGKEEIVRVMNCPFASWNADNRFWYNLVDEESCSSCHFRRQGACEYAEAFIKMEQEAIFDVKSKTPLYVWRFECCHCGHPVMIISSSACISTGDEGRCRGCGAFHSYIHSEEKEGDYFVVTPESDKKSLKRLNQYDRTCEYAVRIPDAEKAIKLNQK